MTSLLSLFEAGSWGNVLKTGHCKLLDSVRHAKNSALIWPDKPCAVFLYVPYVTTWHHSSLQVSFYTFQMRRTNAQCNIMPYRHAMTSASPSPATISRRSTQKLRTANHIQAKPSLLLIPYFYTQRWWCLFESVILGRWHIFQLTSWTPVLCDKLTVTLLLYAFFWVIPRRLNFVCRRFGTLCLFHIHRQVVVWRMN